MVLYGPTAKREHTTIMTLYNSSYRRNEVLESLNAFSGDVWCLIALTGICLALICQAYNKDIIDNFFCALRVLSHAPLTTGFMLRLRGVNRFVFTAILIMVYCIIITFGNLIRASASVRMNTKMFDDPHELINSGDYAPVWWCGHLDALTDDNDMLAIQVSWVSISDDTTNIGS